MNVTFIKLKFHMIVSVIYTALQDLVAEMCNDYFQRFRRQTYVTPKSYLSFIAGYKTIYSEKKGEIGILAERMNTGKYIGVSAYLCQVHNIVDTSVEFIRPLSIWVVMLHFHKYCKY